MAKIIAGEQYVDMAFDGEDLRGADLSECVCTRCTFVGTNLTDARCNGAIFQDCSFENAKLAGVNLFDTRFIGCKLTGVDFTNKTKIMATVFETSLLDYANLSGIDLAGQTFDRCSLIETNFSKSELRTVVFAECVIQGALFTGAHFEQTDFHTSTLSGINIYDEKMRGVILSSQQFLALAGEVGITIL